MTPEQKLKQYEENMKIFIEQVKKQVAMLIEKYEAEIKRLKNENKKLKSSQFRHNPEASYQFKDEEFQNFSPIKKLNSNSPFIDSTFYMTSKQFPKIKPIYDHSDAQFGYQNQVSRSRFQSSRLKRKQIQQDLIHSLQSGRNNLDLNTTRMIQLFGKQKKEVEEEFEEDEEEEARPKSLTKSSGGLNTSLASICESLDKSFHAQKSRQKAIKKKKKEQKLQGLKAEQAKQKEKMLKDEGIKNLLKSLRNNVNNLSDHPPEIIRGSKLLSSGRQGGSKLTKSKVMFNPVPVDITQRERKSNNTSFNTNQPQSILKSSSRILTKSLIGNMTSISQQL